MLVFFNSWVAFTLALFHFGPIEWSQSGNSLVSVVVLTSLAFFNAGTMLGRRTPALPATEFPIIVNSSFRWWIAILFVILSAFHTYSVTGRLIFDPSAYSVDFNAVYLGYQETLRGRNAEGLENALLLLKALMMPAVILLIVTSFRRETPLLLLVLFPFMASGMMRGTDKETVDLMLFLLVLSYFHKLMGRRFLIFLAVLAGVLALFAIRKMARFEGVDLHCLPASPQACFDFNNWLSTNLSPGVEFLRIMLTNYIAQGYEGMGRALSIPFEFSWGMGHMQPVKQKLCEFFGLLCDVETFNDRLPDYGWDTRYRWSSAYTAIANDFHWIFLPIYTFLLGLLFGVSEKSWWQNGDRFSLACLLLVTLFFVYASANMQLTISLEWSVVYLFLFVRQFARLIVNSPSYVGSSTSGMRSQ